MIGNEFTLHINKMVDALELPEDQSTLASKTIRQEILGESQFSSEEGITILNATNYFFWSSVEILKKNYFEEQKKSQLYKEFYEDLIDFYNAAESFLKSSNKPNIVKMLNAIANEDAEVPNHIYFKEYDSTFRGVQRIYEHLSFIKMNQQGRGRPTHKVFYDYLYSVALLYQTLSSKKFRFLRHQSPEGYLPVTNGHLFLFEAIQLVNLAAKQQGCCSSFSDVNIYNGCEYISKRINSATPDKIS